MQVCQNAFELVQEFVCLYNSYTINISWSFILFILILSIGVFHPTTCIEYNCVFWAFCPENPKFVISEFLTYCFYFNNLLLLNSNQAFFLDIFIFSKTDELFPPQALRPRPNLMGAELVRIVDLDSTVVCTD
jgi:hypothetical protein